MRKPAAWRGFQKYEAPQTRIRTLNEGGEKRGVIAFSSGNHAQAVALRRWSRFSCCYRNAGDAPKSKIAATRGYALRWYFYDRQRDDREVFTREIAEREKNLPWCHPTMIIE